ncbi:hypothetical protein OAK35_01790 [Crocinitomicaceae bacterium]|nr:hypothetical protein [Crocinitomicaceae bacterium]
MPSPPDQIIRVTYFNLNYFNPNFFYQDFHQTDLGIEIEFKNGTFIHLGWNGNHHPEFHNTPYDAVKLFDSNENFSRVDATKEWYSVKNKIIESVEVDFVSEQLRIPEKCTLKFKDGSFVHIVVSENESRMDVAPRQMMYGNYSEFFVFINRETPPIRQVRFKSYKEDTAEHPDTKTPAINIFQAKTLGMIMVIIPLSIAIIHYIINNIL